MFMAEAVKKILTIPEPVQAVERVPEIIEVHKVPVWIGGLSTAAILIAGLTMAWVYMLQSHISATESSLEQARITNSQLATQLDDTKLRMQAQGSALAQKIGLSQKELQQKSEVIVEQEKKTIAVAAAASKAAQQRIAATNERVENVQTQVSSVKTDVSAMKSDVATTQAEQFTIKKSVAKVAADQNELGSKIAVNVKEVETIKHKADRVSFPFAIEKGAKPINLSTIKLSTSMVDEKNNRFTLIIDADDKRIEKKEQTLNQAITFYSGKDPQLFEIVINGISKKMIAGYLNVPASAPKPIVP
jgi:chromosome segregation ATPase